ncbi:spore germination protein [Lutispora saccharofermentans]|uniref:Spore germination protein n=1 Tax=Lutispora saccharofermentans TaxID=3024236 RepID=A0ABT1NFW2_9FIRM|nr:spore germination protein [Lutispora saccharofermentans]MCQ1530157.1 spore germination protein [Lutispora saccharofermentans]
MGNENMELNIGNLTALIGHSSDISIKDIYAGAEKAIKVTLIFIEGLVQKDHLSNFILKPLLESPYFRCAKNEDEIIDLIESGGLYFPEQKKLLDIDSAASDILSGNALLIFNKSAAAFSFNVQGFDTRNITEPSNENVIKGPKDSFVETFSTNIATIRRKIRTIDLIIKEVIIGKQTKTPVGILYIRNLANESMVDEITKKIQSIDVDGVLTTSVIEERLRSNKLSPFPQLLYTERPDKFCSNLLEGRVGILIDGLPVTLIAPATFVQFMQAPEDYSQNFIYSSSIRLLRFILTILTLFLPGFYIAVTSFHQEMIPTQLALSIQISKEGVPFPTFIETLGLLIAFEILVEAGIRLPKTVGQALSIVGAVVVGQAAVDAKLVSPAVVVMIASTAISSYVMPNQDFSNAIRLWRFIIAISSSIAGLFGMTIAGILLIYHLCTIDNYSVPYLSPFVSTDSMQFQDTFFRLPLSFMKNRPVNLKTKNKKRRN